MALRFEVAGKTDTGIVRKNNEDAFAVDAKHGIFVLCDGMGGHASGEVASGIAVSHIVESLRTRTSAVESIDALETTLENAIQDANQSIIQRSKSDGSLSGMGTTVVALYATKAGIASVAHVGDSRAYLIRGNSISRLTTDHSLVMEQVKRGQLTLEEADHSPLQNVLLRALGKNAPAEVECSQLVLRRDDRILLICDGITKVVPDNAILEIVNSGSSLESCCDQLIAAAKNAKSDDNLTAVLVHVKNHWLARLFSFGE